jgi:hypothetical protein
MTISQRHINIEGLILAGLANELRSRGFPERHVCLGVGGRRALRAIGFSFDSQSGPRPDLWVIDGKQPYAIEVGRTNPDKWGRAFPIAHVTFRGCVAIYDALFTPFEHALVESLKGIAALNTMLDDEELEDRETALAEGCDECGAPPGTECADDCGDDGYVAPPPQPTRVKRQTKKKKKRVKKKKKKVARYGCRRSLPSKLTGADVTEIQRRWINNETLRSLAKAFDVSVKTIVRIVHRRA